VCSARKCGCKRNEQDKGGQKKIGCLALQFGNLWILNSQWVVWGP
jgi:hypothetical protein